MVVLGDLGELLRLREGLAAVPQFFYGQHKLNSGLLVIQREYLSDAFCAKLDKCGRSGDYELDKHDQGILNAVLDGDFVRLDAALQLRQAAAVGRPARPRRHRDPALHRPPQALAGRRGRLQPGRGALARVRAVRRRLPGRVPGGPRRPPPRPGRALRHPARGPHRRRRGGPQGGRRAHRVRRLPGRRRHPEQRPHPARRGLAARGPRPRPDERLPLRRGRGPAAAGRRRPQPGRHRVRPPRPDGLGARRQHRGPAARHGRHLRRPDPPLQPAVGAARRRRAGPGTGRSPRTSWRTSPSTWTGRATRATSSSRRASGSAFGPDTTSRRWHPVHAHRLFDEAALERVNAAAAWSSAAAACSSRTPCPTATAPGSGTSPTSC